MASEGTEFMEFDPIKDQDERLHQILSRISIETLEPLLKSEAFSVCEMKRLENSRGTINVVYMVTVCLLPTGEEYDQVLRVTNPWLKWKGRMQSNEVYILNKLKQWNQQHKDPEQQIPVPSVWKHSSDAATSSLGCEFSFVTRMEGENAEDVIPQLGPAQRATLWKDYLRIAKLIKSIPASFMFPSSHAERFSKYMCSFGSMSEKMEPVLRDGSPVGPIQTPAEYHMASLRSAIHDIESCTILHQYLGEADIEQLKRRSKEFLRKLETGEIDKERIWPKHSYPLTLCHDDLHSGNLLVDPDTGKITAVLDWDRSHWGLHDDNIHDWGQSLISDLFTGEDAEKAKDELESCYPGTEDMKIRHYWRQVPDTITWTANIVATWLGPPLLSASGKVVDRDPEQLKSFFSDAWKACSKALDKLDEELKLGEKAFLDVPKDDDDDSESSDEE
jgi:hypothetical protein